MEDRSILIEECEQALTESDLQEVERQLGYTLPTSIRTHYLRFNGGYLPQEQMDRQRLAFGGFYAIRYDPLPAEQLYRDLTDSFAELEGWFPFAYDQGGNCFLMDLDMKRSRGKIGIWLMDEEEVVTVSDDFEEFLARLFEK